MVNEINSEAKIPIGKSIKERQMRHDPIVILNKSYTKQETFAQAAKPFKANFQGLADR
jgi:hypothetical protein